MFDKFGEFDSAHEINQLAENLFNEGDFTSIRVVAKENGIPEEFVDAYLNGEIEEICDPMTAAIGKLEVEEAELKPQGLMKDWVEYIKAQCMSNDLICHKIRKKGKSMKGCIAALLKYSFAHQVTISSDIIKAAGVTANRVTMGEPDMGTAKKLIREYYMEG